MQSSGWQGSPADAAPHIVITPYLPNNPPAERIRRIEHAAFPSAVVYWRPRWEGHMPLCRSDRNSLELAGFALAEGVARVSAGLEVSPTLVVWENGTSQCIPVSRGLPPRTQASLVLGLIGPQVHAAALLTERRRPLSRSLRALAWVEGAWRFDIELPFTPGAPLRVQPERIRGVRPRCERRQALDAVYCGVSGHPQGLEAWVRAEVDL